MHFNALKTLATSAALSLALPVSVALADDNGGVASMDTTANLAANYGNGVCTAAINSDGTVAGGASVNKNTSQTRKISTGTYEIDFKAPCANVTVERGYARYVQPDTLQVGSLAPRVCTTANRSGDASSVWVVCYDLTGALTDTSFLLTITR